jgi:hypothetical protein
MKTESTKNMASQDPEGSVIIRSAGVDFQRRVRHLGQRVMLEKVPLSRIAMPVREPEPERVSNALRRLMVEIFDRIQILLTQEGATDLIQEYRRQISYLFDLEEAQLPPSPEQMKKELMNSGRIYLFGNVVQLNEEFMEKIRWLLECAFIPECHNVDQQREIIKLSAQLTPEKTAFQGKLAGYSIFKIDDVLLQKMIVISLFWNDGWEKAYQKAYVEADGRPDAGPEIFVKRYDGAGWDDGDIVWEEDWEIDLDK